MKQPIFKALLLSSALFAGVPSLSIAAESGSTAIQQSVSGAHRSADHKARDVYRHPEETLNFFGVEEGMTVVELWPGGKGWYSEILAPLVKEKGKLYAAHFAADSDVPYYTENLKKYQQKLAGNPAVYGSVVLTTLHPPKALEIAPAGTADRVLTFRNVHNWMKSGTAEAVFKAAYQALKPGGILGVVEHRGDPAKPQDPEAKSGYVIEADVIKLAEAAGFKLVGQSEINANPKDIKDYPKGVWSLPPSLKLKEQDRDKYLAIGESDRMTLKFQKPEK